MAGWWARDTLELPACGSRGLRAHGTIVRWLCGITEPWAERTLDPWFFGTRKSQTHGTVVPCNPRFVGLRKDVSQSSGVES